MIISDLNYQETAAEANDLEGGLDLGISATLYDYSLNTMQTGSFSGTGVTAAFANSVNLDILSASLGIVALDV